MNIAQFRILPAVFYSIVLFISVAANFRITEIQCPKRCTCIPDIAEQDRLVVTCKWLTTPNDNLWDQQLFSQLTQNITKSLSIECDNSQSEQQQHSNTVTFHENLLSKFQNLLNLRLQKCHLHTLPSILLHGMTNLRSVYFNQLNVANETLVIPSEFFRYNKRLEKLTITDCNLQTLPDSLFCDNPYIQVINISRNSLRNLNFDGSSTPKCNNNAEQLIIFDSSYNKIQFIADNDLSRFVAIRQLLLAHNQIDNINRNVLKTCTLLQQLHINNNYIKELPIMPETLIHLDVAYNRLSIIPATIANLPNLLFLNISGNAIDANTPFSMQASTLESIDLSRNRFEVIPENLFANSCARLQHLFMSNNRITQLEPRIFQNYTNLITLDFGSNRIAEVEEESLLGLSNLTYLYLSNNSIYQVETNSFQYTRQLQQLNLARNLLVEVPLEVGHLFKLRQLDLSYNQISKAYKFLFNKLPYLHSLNLHKNKLPSIELYIFSDIPRLIELNLSFNIIDNIAEAAFTKCPKLRQIDLSNNYLTNFNGALRGLQSLKRLNASYNIIQLIEWDEFPATMIHLDMGFNEIAKINKADMSRVRHVQLQHNRIMSLSGEQIPNTLETIDLRDNIIHNIENGTFRNKSSLISINLRNNALSILQKEAFEVDNLSSTHSVRLKVSDNPLICSCEMDWILTNEQEKSQIDISDDNQAKCSHRFDKRKIQLSELTKDDLLCSYKQICEPNCICCQYGNCDCKSKCPQGCNCYHDATFIKNIVRCSALSIEDRKKFTTKDLPMYATHIYLENMEIPVIQSHDFLGRTRLLHLHINHSSIREIQPLAFNTLPSLQLLDLSGNHLIRLTGDELFRTNKITTFFLHNNMLMSLGNRLNEIMPILNTITLHNNKLEDLPQSIEQYGKQLKDISLGHNLFRCDCSFRFHTQFWLPRNLDIIRDVSDVLCVENVTHAIRENDTTILSPYPPNFGEDIFRIPMAQFIATANTTICAPTASGVFGTKGTTNSFLVIAVLFGTAIISTGLILLAILTLRKTKAVTVQRRYKVPPSFTGTRTTPGSSPLPLIHFDAFISYSKKDEKFIIDTLCRQLEYEEYILCLLHRDGPNYSSRLHTISDELINQMECAQSLILVLTLHFLDNEWKTLQIKTSHQIFAKNRHKKLIAVLGDGIEPNQLDAELGQILRKNTCIRMNDPLFWNLLHSALPIKIAPSSCSAGSSQIYSDCYGSIVPSDIV